MYFVMEERRSSVRWYNPPRKQLDMFYDLNVEHRWGFTSQEFMNLRIPQHFQPKNRSEILTLCFYLPADNLLNSIKRTMVEHLRVIRERPYTRSQSIQCWDEFCELDGLKLRYEPENVGLKARWCAYDYAAGWDPNRCKGEIIKTQQPQRSSFAAASEVLSAMVFMPAYGPSMDGRITPFANLAGYDLDGAIPAVEWVHHEHLLSFFSNHSGTCNGCWASPTVRYL